MITTITRKRKKLGVSQYALAKMSKVGRYRISLLECGYAEATTEEVNRLEEAISGIERQTGSSGRG